MFIFHLRTNVFASDHFSKLFELKNGVSMLVTYQISKVCKKKDLRNGGINIGNKEIDIDKSKLKIRITLSIEIMHHIGQQKKYTPLCDVNKNILDICIF